MKILITGVAGLVGSHLLDHLMVDSSAPHEIIGIDDLSYGKLSNIKRHLNSPGFTLVNARLQEYYTLDRFDVIFHLATLKKTFNGVNTTPVNVMENSVSMAQRLNGLVYSDSKPHVIFAGTSDIYGNSETFRETSKPDLVSTRVPRYSYAMTKLWEEQYYMNLMSEGRLECTVARIFGCTSPRAKRSWSGGHVPLFLDNAMRGDDIVIHGDGLQTRSIAHANTIAHALFKMMHNRDKVSGEIINIGSHQEMSVRTAAEIIKKVANSNSNIVHIPAKQAFGYYEEITRRWADTRKAEKLLGMKFEDDFTSIVTEMYNEWNK